MTAAAPPTVLPAALDGWALGAALGWTVPDAALEPAPAAAVPELAAPVLLGPDEDEEADAESCWPSSAQFSPPITWPMNVGSCHAAVSKAYDQQY